MITHNITKSYSQLKDLYILKKHSPQLEEGKETIHTKWIKEKEYQKCINEAHNSTQMSWKIISEKSGNIRRKENLKVKIDDKIIDDTHGIANQLDTYF